MEKVTSSTPPSDEDAIGGEDENLDDDGLGSEEPTELVDDPFNLVPLTSQDKLEQIQWVAILSNALTGDDPITSGFSHFKVGSLCLHSFVQLCSTYH
jgi:hypothetical protein